MSDRSAIEKAKAAQAEANDVFETAERRQDGVFAGQMVAAAADRYGQLKSLSAWQLSLDAIERWERGHEVSERAARALERCADALEALVNRLGASDG